VVGDPPDVADGLAAWSGAAMTFRIRRASCWRGMKDSGDGMGYQPCPPLEAGCILASTDDDYAVWTVEINSSEELVVLMRGEGELVLRPDTWPEDLPLPTIIIYDDYLE